MWAFLFNLFYLKYKKKIFEATAFYLSILMGYFFWTLFGWASVLSFREIFFFLFFRFSANVIFPIFFCFFRFRRFGLFFTGLFKKTGPLNVLKKCLSLIDYLFQLYFTLKSLYSVFSFIFLRFLKCCKFFKLELICKFLNGFLNNEKNDSNKSRTNRKTLF